MIEAIRSVAKDRLSWPKRVMFLSIVLSALGIVIGTAFDNPPIGNLGGVLGIALSFFILFLGRATAERALETRIASLDDLSPRTSREPAEGEEIETRIGRLEESNRQVRASLSAMFDWSAKEKRYLTISSVISTLTSGFGQYASCYLHALLFCVFAT